MSFDKIFDITPGVYFYFYSISHTACEDEFRQNLRCHRWSVLPFFVLYSLHLGSEDLRHIQR